MKEDLHSRGGGLSVTGRKIHVFKGPNINYVTLFWGKEAHACIKPVTYGKKKALRRKGREVAHLALLNLFMTR